jgi:cytochrome c-type biogenesis protein CcmE
MSEERVELAPLPKNAKILAAAAVLVAAVGLALVTLGGLGENLIFYWTPTEMKAAGEKAYGATIRLGGQVVEGSIQKDAAGTRLSFRVGDGTTEFDVDAQAMPPAMFREKIGVVVEGTLLRSNRFAANRLMVKHDNEYRAPGESDSDTKALMKTTEGLQSK